MISTSWSAIPESEEEPSIASGTASSAATAGAGVAAPEVDSSSAERAAVTSRSLLEAPSSERQRPSAAPSSRALANQLSGLCAVARLTRAATEGGSVGTLRRGSQARLGADGLDDLPVGPLEGTFADQTFVEDHARGVNVAPAVFPLVADALGRGVAVFSNEQPARRRTGGGAGCPEVDQLGGAARRQDDVVGAEIAMQEPEWPVRVRRARACAGAPRTRPAGCEAWRQSAAARRRPSFACARRAG